MVRHGKVITAAGVSAGIDMALYLAGEIAGRERAEVIQLGIEYDPPPLLSGRPLVEGVRAGACARHQGDGQARAQPARGYVAPAHRRTDLHQQAQEEEAHVQRRARGPARDQDQDA
jgi:hypothetical protein